MSLGSFHGESHGYFFIIPEGDLVRPSQLAKAQETGESGVELSIEQEVVVDDGQGEVGGNGE